MTAAVARSVVVTGEVQGVLFRDSLLREATAAGVAGWVRNRPDGSVEAHIEGDPAAVVKVVLWCRTGPRHATVEDLVVDTIEPAGCESFRIR